MKFAIFISGRGSNMAAILKAVKSGAINAECALVFADRRSAEGLKKAQEAGIETLVLERKDYATPQSYDRDIVVHLKQHKIDFIVMAGYMKVVTPFFIKQFPNKILNVHPSLLPAFKGAKGIKDTFTYGCKVAGVTIHFVDEKMDHGPIIMQESIKIAENDTLKTLEIKIHKVEHRIYPKAIAMFVDGRLRVKGRQVEISDK